MVVPNNKANVKLIILPGWEQHSFHWERVTNKLKNDFEVEVIDMPGFGNESLVSQDWGLPEYANWIKNKIETNILYEVRQDQKIVLLGHSFGGRVAHYLACTYQPDWLKGLILYAAPILYRPSLRIKSQNILAKVIKKMIPTKILPKSWKQVFYSDDLKNSLDSGKEKIFRKVVTFDQTELLKYNKYPTVLLWGSEDESVSVAIAKEIQQKTANSTLVILPHEGHNIHLSNPNLFYGTLKQILTNNF